LEIVAVVWLAMYWFDIHEMELDPSPPAIGCLAEDIGRKTAAAWENLYLVACCSQIGPCRKARTLEKRMVDPRLHIRSMRKIARWNPLLAVFVERTPVPTWDTADAVVVVVAVLR